MSKSLICLKDSVMTLPKEELSFDPLSYCAQADSSYPSVQLIHLGHLNANYDLLQQKIGASLIAPAVKANAYGLGAIPITQSLYEKGARHFFVATLQEGLELRYEFEDINIYVLYGLDSFTLPFLIQSRLTPVLNSLSQIRIWRDFCHSHAYSFPAVIHYDSGINRLGLTDEELQIFLGEHRDKDFPIAFIMSHLACADEKDHPLTSFQRQKILLLKSKMPSLRFSFANSAGCFLEDSFHEDIVRPGISLYGGNPLAHQPNPMHPVLYLFAKILQIKKVSSGETIGYGATYKATQDMRIGLLAYGYADGYLRSASNKGKVYYKGHFLKILGRISMDLIAFDLTPLDKEDICEGDYVELIGKHLSLDKVADSMSTISYEVLTSLKDRSYRIYVR